MHLVKDNEIIKTTLYNNNGMSHSTQLYFHLAKLCQTCSLQARSGPPRTSVKN